MESFYGGQQGFSFVIKRNPAEGHNGYFYDIGEINNAAEQGILRYGDYAIITQQDLNNFNESHGDLYRINAQRKAERVANISHPAVCGIFNDIGNYNEDVGNALKKEISFLNTQESKNTDKLKISLEHIYDSQSDGENKVVGYKLGIDAPRPVIESTINVLDTYRPNVTVTDIEEKPFFKTINISLPRVVDVKRNTTIQTIEEDELQDGLIIFDYNPPVEVMVSEEMFEDIDLANFYPVEESQGSSSWRYINVDSEIFDVSKYNFFQIVTEDLLENNLQYSISMETIDSDSVFNGKFRSIDNSNITIYDNVAFLKLTFRCQSSSNTGPSNSVTDSERQILKDKIRLLNILLFK